MAEIMDDVVHLSQEIGPHPAGTEEEQQAALYLAEEMQKGSGFATIIEDFQCVTNYTVPNLICFGLAFIAVFVSIVFPVVTIPCFLLSAVAAVLFGLEIFQKPVLSRLLRTGASQNVVAKYQPASTGTTARRRKVILVANYDTGKVLQEETLPFKDFLPVIYKASAVALAVAVILLFFKMTVFSADTGAISSIITMLLVICLLLFAFSLARAVFHITSPFSQSANNNAAGVSVLLDVARRVGSGLVSNEEAEQRANQEGVSVHGEAAARNAGVVPEGASLEYDANMNPQESLAAAKAAIAALTGKPVADKVPVTDISSRLVKGGGLDPVDEEAVSSVHFEVSETPQVRTERPGRFRTMVSMEDENAEGSHQAEANTPRSRVEKKIQEDEEEQAKEQAEHREAEAETKAAIPFVSAAPFATSSSAHPNDPFSFAHLTGDATPSWAKKAQEKARKNKPEESQPHKVSRSRYADTVAAQLTENQVSRQREFENQSVQQNDSSFMESDNPELAHRLAALRSEIESASAPHIDDSTQAMLDNMQISDKPTSATEIIPEQKSAPVTAAASTVESISKQEQDTITVPAEEHAYEVRADHSINQPTPEPETPIISKEEAVIDQSVAKDNIEQRNSLESEKTDQYTIDQVHTDEESTEPFEMVINDSVARLIDNGQQEELAKEPDYNDSHQTKESLQETQHETSMLKTHGFSKEGLSRSIRKAAGSSHAFASRLKSIASRKMNPNSQVQIDDGVEENNVPSESEIIEAAPNTESHAVSIYSDTGNKKSRSEDSTWAIRRSAEESKNTSGSMLAEQKNDLRKSEELQIGQTQSVQGGSEVIPFADTSTVAPMDVSGFMNKNRDQEEDFFEEEVFEESDLYSGSSSYDPAEYTQTEEKEGQTIDESALMQSHEPDGFSLEDGPIDQPTSKVFDATTERVSAKDIEEALQEANSHEIEVSPREDSGEPVEVVSPIVGMENMIPQIPITSEEPSAKSEKRQVIVLPDVTTPHSTSSESVQQRAPMAETNESAKAGSKALLSNMLPKIGDTDSFDTVKNDSKSVRDLHLPSIGGTGANSAVSATGSFSVVGATGSFAPVGDELVADIAPEERYVEDADDSAYDEDYTETGAYAGTGYVEMPKSRIGRLFGRLGKKKKGKENETSVNDWVNVDDSYNARSVGKARGDWSSFREETDSEFIDTPAPNNDGFVDVDYHKTDFDRRGWNGGAFSLNRMKGEFDSAEEPASANGKTEPAYSEVSTATNFVEANPAVRIDGDSATAAQINRELRKLQDFRHPDIDTEVWFVALGSEQYSHSGINAFLEEHADEMKGAVIINLEGLGAGTLSVVDQESTIIKDYKPSSRIKRFVRQASDRSGVTYRSSAMTRKETPATVAMSHGIQAFTIAGMADGTPALYSAENDIVENLDPEMLKQASDFVMAILKCI